jgi:peptide/nickel transport system substrate-binding protein
MVRQSRLLLGAIATLVVATVLITSSSLGHPLHGSAASGDTLRTAATQPKNGGTLTYGEYSPILTLDPTQAYSYGLSDGTELTAIYGSLMRFDSTSKSYVPSMAQSLTPNANDTVWTLTLRPGVKFSDGEPFDAGAVVMNLDRDLKTEQQVAADSLYFLQSVAAPDGPSGLRVTINLTAPSLTLGLALSINPGNIVAPATLAQFAAGKTSVTPIGAGPFTVASFVPGTQLTLQRNSTYWAGAAHLDQLKFVSISGGSGTLQAFQVGQLQAAVLFDPRPIKQAVDSNVPRINQYFNQAYQILLSQYGNSPFKNVKLRQAVAYAVIPSVINERVFGSGAQASDALVSQGSAYYQPSVKGWKYDPAKARELVSAVKKQTGWNGDVTYLGEGTPDSSTFGVALASMLDPVGFHVKIRNDSNQDAFFNDLLVTHNYDIAQYGNPFGDADLFEGLFQGLYSKAPDSPTGYKNAQMDQALISLNDASSTAAIKSGLRKVNSIFLNTVPVVPVAGLNAIVIHQANVHGLYLSLEQIVYFDKAWIS